MSELLLLFCTTTKACMSELYSASLAPYPMSLSAELLSQLFFFIAKGCRNDKRDYHLYATCNEIIGR